jgi:UDP-3-O-[3-hydroxymyristoyl] N-acetylglucosamine deacetylase
MTGVLIIEGVSLSQGAWARVSLSARPGPVVLSAAGEERALRELRVVGTARSTTVQLGDARVAMVEHLFAACAGVGVREGLAIEVEGGALPLLDGAARAWCDALAGLELASASPSLRVRRDDEVVVGESRYRFSTGTSPRVRVAIDFGDPRLAGEASWAGSSPDFVERIAPARTFTLARELEELALAGASLHVEPESAVVLTPNAIHAAGRPFTSDEPARHKLLDMIGDLYLYGGPPRGTVEATRPGHGATHAAMRIAIERGMVE